MKGLITKALAGVCGAGLLALAGCTGIQTCYDNAVDPCYPQRYEAMARHEVNEAMAPQMMNGHVLDQTVWNEQFEAGTDKLTVGGQEHLKVLAQCRPHADPVVFVQAAQDVAYDPANVDAYVRARAELNDKRVQAVHAFLSAYTAAAPVDFRVVVHDAPEAGQSAVPVARSILLRNNAYQGALPTGGGGGGTSGGGGAH